MNIDTPPPDRGRKRAASSPPPLDEEPDVVVGVESNDVAERTASRARIASDLDNLGLIPKEEAWQLNLDEVLGSGIGLGLVNGPVLLCTIGTMNVQMDLTM